MPFLSLISDTPYDPEDLRICCFYASKGRQEFGAGRLVLWVLLGPGVCFGVVGGLFVLVVV